MQRHKIDITEAKRLYANGESLRSIAQLFDVSSQTAGRVLVAAGIELRGMRKTPIQRKKLSVVRSAKIDENALRELASMGMSTLELGDQLGYSEEAIRRRMIALDIPRLPAKARMEKNYFWKGGRTQDDDGYWLVKSPGHPYATKAGYVREHRLVMERKLGRHLLPHEVVDHIDGNTSNNAENNLRVFQSNADHLRTTLKGRVPKWTEDGRLRIQQGNQRKWQKRQSSQMVSETDADLLS